MGIKIKEDFVMNKINNEITPGTIPSASLKTTGELQIEFAEKVLAPLVVSGINRLTFENSSKVRIKGLDGYRHHFHLLEKWLEETLILKEDLLGRVYLIRK